ncbi:hypothetical protein BSKO_09146 [Bryopsis sp. KO-2023]|nr:hypothetical protein BSKO_09146 [Bryopsis sp. KO-2023]
MPPEPDVDPGVLPLGGPGNDAYAYCHNRSVNYGNYNDFYDQDHYNWCVVPGSAFDAILFGAVGVLLACIVPKKYYAILVLVAGGFFQFLNLEVNLGHFGNGIDLWLGMQPAEIFFYVFLPPLLLDSAVRIEYFVFKKVMVQVLVFAFLVVLCNTALLGVFMLYGLDLRHSGWQWSHAFLFATMVASTDAVAVTAVLKQGGGPESLSVLIEGESLFNDATSIVLFEFFLEKVKHLHKEGVHEPDAGVGEILQNMVFGIAVLAIGGAGIGLLFGVATQLAFKLLHYQRGKNSHIEVALTVGAAYMCFYIANETLKVSGVIAVVVYGLYGSATLNWYMSSKARESGVFQTFWDVIGLVINGMVFFFSGASAYNFFQRSMVDIYQDKTFSSAFVTTFMWVPVIYVAIFAFRFALITLFSPLLRLFRAPISFKAIIFVSFAGLRGSLSLIMAQTVVTLPHPPKDDPNLRKVRAQIALWTSGFVLLTLLVNAPMIPVLLRWTGLNRVTLIKLHMVERAKEALTDYTDKVISLLQSNKGGMLRGVDWAAVSKAVALDGAPEVKTKKEGNVKRVMSKHTDLSRTSWPLLKMMGGSEDAEAGLTDEDRLTLLNEELMYTSMSDEDVLLSVGFSDKKDSALFADMNDVKPVQPLPGKAPAPLNIDAGSACPHWLHLGYGSVVIVSGIDETYRAPSVDSEFSPIPERPEAPTPDSGPSIRPSRSTSLPANAFSTARDSMGSSGRDSLDKKVAAGSSDRSRIAGVMNWTRIRSAKLESVDERGNVEQSLLGPQELVHTSSGGPNHRTLDYDHVQKIWEGRGMTRHPSLRTYNRELMVEARVRLAAGMKHFFFEKRKVGLLSSQGLRVLNWVCDIAIDEASTSLSIFESIQKDLLGSVLLKFCSRISYTLRAWMVKLRRAHKIVQVLVLPIVKFISHFLTLYLSSRMLLALEVCIEYWLALGTFRSQAPWLVHADLVTLFTEEIKTEAKKVWRFIIDREIEAPERFQAIQTYRATMSALLQQLQYVEQLSSCGLLEESEHEMMHDLIEEKVRKLERQGVQWRQPIASDVLKTVPFMSNASSEVFLSMLSEAKLHMYSEGELVDGQNGMVEQGSVHVVVSGLLKSYFTDSRGRQHEFFLGKGGVLGLLPALVGQSHAGMGPAYAELNSLGRGPVILTLPASLLHKIRHSAAGGDPEYQQLELDMFRLAAVYFVEGMQHEIVETATSFFMKRGMGPVLQRRTSDRRSHDGMNDFINLMASHVRQTVADEHLEGEHPELISRGPGVIGAIDPMEGEAPSGTLLRECQVLATEMYDEIIDSLNESDLLLLPPDHVIEQASGLVLLHGSLKTTPPQQPASLSPFSENEPQTDFSEVLAPAILPYFVEDIGVNIEARRFWSGSSGAVILSCPVNIHTQVPRNTSLEEAGVIIRRDTNPDRHFKRISSTNSAYAYNEVMMSTLGTSLE